MVVEDEKGQFNEEVPSRVNPLQLLNAFSAGGNFKRLSYAQVEINRNGAGHLGKKRMYALLSPFYYWPKMELDIELYVKTCLVCQQDKGLT